MIQILKQRHVDQIQLTWMKMNAKCYKNVERDSPTLKARKLNARLVRSNLKKLDVLLNFKSKENLNKLASMFIDQSKSVE